MKTLFRNLAKTAVILALLIALGAVFIYSGLYNVAATSRHAQPVERIFRILMMRSVVSHARGVRPPVNFNSLDPVLAENIAGHYEEMCRTCHGAPGKKPDSWHLYPPAPDLSDALRVMRWSDAEVFWIIKNGLKDTGMSAFGPSHDDDDLWALTAFVRQLQTVTPERYRAMTAQAAVKKGPGRDSMMHATESAEPHKH